NPGRFYGSVKVNGDWAPSGTLIAASIENAAGTWSANAFIVDGQSVYVVDVPADSPRSPKHGGAAGDVVGFKVRCGSREYQAAQTGIWAPGKFVGVNLDVGDMAPLAILASHPNGVVNYATADIAVGGPNIVAYKYRLDAGYWSGETVVGARILLSGLSDGVHVIYVRGKNAAGSWQREDLATTASWTVDTTLLAKT
ncbi:MAG: hypothetical protein NTU41_13460, partial [Chloroflexi bacterium]|nr:hypothetical protein [Chloroflexota bacterium]